MPPLFQAEWRQYGIKPGHCIDSKVVLLEVTGEYKTFGSGGPTRSKVLNKTWPHDDIS
jgi:hypothetical protein